MEYFVFAVSAFDVVVGVVDGSTKGGAAAITSKIEPVHINLFLLQLRPCPCRLR